MSNQSTSDLQSLQEIKLALERKQIPETNEVTLKKVNEKIEKLNKEVCLKKNDYNYILGVCCSQNNKICILTTYNNPLEAQHSCEMYFSEGTIPCIITNNQNHNIEISKGKIYVFPTQTVEYIKEQQTDFITINSSLE